MDFPSSQPTYMKVINDQNYFQFQNTCEEIGRINVYLRIQRIRLHPFCILEEYAMHISFPPVLLIQNHFIRIQQYYQKFLKISREIYARFSFLRLKCTKYKLNLLGQKQCLFHNILIPKGLILDSFVPGSRSLWIRIGKKFRIQADADPQHCFPYIRTICLYPFHGHEEYANMLSA